MMNGTEVEQTVVRTGLCLMSWIEVGNQIVKGKEDIPLNWMFLGGEGDKTQNARTKMDKTIT